MCPCRVRVRLVARVRIGVRVRVRASVRARAIRFVLLPISRATGLVPPPR